MRQCCFTFYSGGGLGRLAYYPTSHDCFLLVSLPSVYKQLLSSALSYDPVERDRLPHSYYCLEMLP
ncbi:hypothetical protein PISMIDRAFT_691031, partial [Pisolithus microcarpus 441]